MIDFTIDCDYGISNLESGELRRRVWQDSRYFWDFLLIEFEDSSDSAYFIFQDSEKVFCLFWGKVAGIRIVKFREKTSDTLIVSSRDLLRFDIGFMEDIADLSKCCLLRC